MFSRLARVAGIVAALVWAAPPLIAQTASAATPGAAATVRPAAERLPASAFARLPFIDEAALSPDGAYFAGLFAVGGEQRIAMMAVLGDRSKNIVLPIPEQTQVAALRWVGNDHLLVQLYALLPVEGDDWYVTRFISVDRASGKVTKLLWDQAGQGAELLWTAKDGSNAALIAAQASIYSNDAAFWPTVFRVDVTTGKKRVVEKGRTNVYDWGADHLGRVRYAVGYRDHTTQSQLLYQGEDGGTLRVVDRAVLSADEALASPLIFLPGNDNALVYADDADGVTEIAEINIMTGARKQMFFRPDKGSVTGAWLSQAGDRILGIYTSDPDQSLTWLDPNMKEMQAVIDAAAPKADANIISISADQSRALVTIGTPDNPGLLYLYDKASGGLNKLAAMNEAIGGKRLSRAKLVRYKARDGLEIEAVLTLPRGRTAKALPFIIMPHGGPWAQDKLAYDYWAQFLAEQGYGVIQPNFRGSTGYGQAFTDKAHGEMGLAMQDDLSDALAWAVGEGIADPKRACIIGASYGGYAAMWGIAKDPELYRCAISISGVSNLRKEVSDFGGVSHEKLFRTQWGRMSRDFAAVSPINAIDRVKAPLLLIHGKKDVTVKHGQSERMHAAMRRAGKASEFLSLPLADHYFAREADRLALLEAMAAFLRQHNSAD
jgi:dipeptidyl aminopeptidase/acylaminoacyl peptidase